MLKSKRIVAFFSITSIVIMGSLLAYYAIPIITPDVMDYLYRDPMMQNQEGNRFTISLFAEGLSFPTSMEFVDNNTIIALEKNGDVRLISNGKVQKEPILSVGVDNEAERGLLGIAILKNNTIIGIDNSTDNNTINFTSKNPESNLGNSNYSVFLYYTEKIKDAVTNNFTTHNRIYEYSWVNHQNLTNPRLVMDLPAELGPYHNGGKLKIGPDKQLYAVIGDLVTINNTLQNRPDESNRTTVPNNSSVIIRIDPTDGAPPKDNPFYKYYNNDSNLKSLSYYYAYGIRNSFGFDFDPLTAKLWDTENGEDKYDEINIVEPGFNSGWYMIMGPLSQHNESDIITKLVKFNGSHYSDPVFSWFKPIGITDIEFFESPKLGKEFENNVFIGDINNGNLYFFKVNATRSGIDTSKFSDNKGSSLDDKVVDNK
ncbi:MAG TPA: PQQ-dependent sugar dehydrogenase, partial [Phototrophicaceae bacterium]|nr:PQQ-dependent sugar dehydrogenase [Phototrophicaceae bacterium]